MIMRIVDGDSDKSITRVYLGAPHGPGWNSMIFKETQSSNQKLLKSNPNIYASLLGTSNS